MSIFSVMNIHFALQASFQVVFVNSFIWPFQPLKTPEAIEGMVLVSCTGQQTVMDTALPVISPGAGGVAGGC